MIFDAGIAKADFRCKCEKLHIGVSIGEERLVCSCGELLTYQKGNYYYDYFWVTKKESANELEHAYNNDERNLC